MELIRSLRHDRSPRSQAAVVLEVSADGLIVESGQRLTRGSRYGLCAGDSALVSRDAIWCQVLFSDARPDALRFITGLQFQTATAAVNYRGLQLLSIARRSVVYLYPTGSPAPAVTAA